ncbi:MAG: pyridoxamine 5'-phosphate oxidase, partial [Cyclobacteriaceae bacterium]
MTDKLNSRDISAIRQEYALKTLSESDVAKDAIVQFENWFEEAMNSEVQEPNAMSLATISQDQYPNVRIVLLKGISDGKFRFYTNYDSQKGNDIDYSPNVSLMFFWPELERQIRIKGRAAKLSAKISDEYFRSRPKGSQIGALVSPQSKVIEDRAVLEQREEELAKAYENKTVPRPENWGGYEVDPVSIEYWQGRR